MKKVLKELNLQPPKVRRKRNKFLNEAPILISEFKRDKLWPRLSGVDHSPPTPPPPWPDNARRYELERYARLSAPDAELSSVARAWVLDLEAWYLKLQRIFDYNPSRIQDNPARSAEAYRSRIKLSVTDPTRRELIMSLVNGNYRLPLIREPKPYFRNANAPDLASKAVPMWTALKKDFMHGAISGWDLRRGLPTVVSPVRTAPKGWDKPDSLRFVCNQRRLNKDTDDDAKKCTLETISRVRNIMNPGDFAWTADCSSGYHHFGIAEEHRTFMAFALHMTELCREAKQWLELNCPYSFHKKSGCFILVFNVLPFGLAPACAAFSSVITAVVGFWRTRTINGSATRLSSYIDDILGVMSNFDDALALAIEVVYEAAALGISLNIQKCALLPHSTSVKYLGLIINLQRYEFSLPEARCQKISHFLNLLRQNVRSRPHAVPAKLVATVIGLLLSIAPVCARACRLMARSMTACISDRLRIDLLASLPNFLAFMAVVRRFWSGPVTWSQAADRELEFWLCVDFRSLRSSVSADIQGQIADAAFARPTALSVHSITWLAQDASGTASGGGRISPSSNGFKFSRDVYFASFDAFQRSLSSTVRELLGTFWLLQGFERQLVPVQLPDRLRNRRAAPGRIIIACDNMNTVEAIKLGSPTKPVQEIAAAIFAWSISVGVVVWPIWIPRESEIIAEADKRSRWTDRHAERSPVSVFNEANAIAIRLWRRPISFDRAASHGNAMPPDPSLPPLPFNSRHFTPGTSGVDMFLQTNWRQHINYVFPPSPVVGRLLGFLPSTRSRSIVIFREPVASTWWTPMTSPNAAGVVGSYRKNGFRIVAIDHSV